MNNRTVQITIAVVFLIVGVIAAVNTFTLQRYIKETLPRDAAQEQCLTDTVAVLAAAAVARARTDEINNTRDDALISVIDSKLEYPEVPLSAEELARYRSAVATARQARQILGQLSDEHPLPACSLGGVK